MFAGLLNWIGSLSAKAGTKACLLWYVDEPIKFFLLIIIHDLYFYL